MAIRLCKVFRICRISDVQRKEDACFFFSQVQSFKYGSANLFRSECVDAESKGDDGFKTVNLHAAFVRQFDGMLCLIFPQNTAFTKSLYPCSDCWGDNPEQLAEFPLGHGNGDCIGRQGDVALSVHRDDASFLFSVFTGLAYSDVKNLTTDNLQTFFDGNLWIITRRKKTNTESNIRLLDVPRKIIEKYKGMAKDNKVFPMPSNTTCNKKLKAIADLCGIKTHLTYHVARHSAATTILLSNGVPIETVSRLLGHTNIKTTQIYAKITAQKISQDLELLSDKLGDMEKSICSAI
jgi:hypothetical protein